jgi:hypothetical protein
MSHENSPQSPRPVLLPDGSLNTEYINETWGINPEFAQQTVTFDTGEKVFSGTVADMLADVECPVGGRASLMYKKGGIEGVANYFSGLITVMGAEFTDGFEPTMETIASEEVKKNMNQIFPETP